MNTQCCFVNTEIPPISTSHITWQVIEQNDELILNEIVEEKYPYPDAPEDAFVFLQNAHEKIRFKKTDEKAAALITFLAAERVCSQIFGKSSGK